MQYEMTILILSEDNDYMITQVTLGKNVFKHILNYTLPTSSTLQIHLILL